MGVGAFVMYLYSFVVAKFLELFTCPRHVGDHYGNVPFVGVVVLLVGIVGAIVVGRLIWVGELVKPLVEGPIGELAML